MPSNRKAQNKMNHFVHITPQVHSASHKSFVNGHPVLAVCHRQEKVLTVQKIQIAILKERGGLLIPQITTFPWSLYTHTHKLKSCCLELVTMLKMFI